MLRENGENALGINRDTLISLITFIKKFKVQYKKEYFSDNLSSYLLREIYVIFRK